MRNIKELEKNLIVILKKWKSFLIFQMLNFQESVKFSKKAYKIYKRSYKYWKYKL